VKNLINIIGKVKYFFFFFFLISLMVAILPEKKSSTSLTNGQSWHLFGNEQQKIKLSEIPSQYQHVRQSSLRDNSANLYRSWTPSHGIEPIILTSPSFIPSKFLAIPIQGSNKSADNSIQTRIICDDSSKFIPIFNGSVNVNLNESIINLPSKWCSGKAHLELISRSKSVLVGIGDPFEINQISYLKTLFIGKFCYFIIFFAVFSFVIFLGCLVFDKYIDQKYLFAYGMSFFGLFSLILFYVSSFLYNLLPHLNWPFSLFFIIFTSIKLAFSSKNKIKKVLLLIFPYLKVWFIFSFAIFLVTHLFSNGLGNWEPNFLFWPASWSSDNELQPMLTEGIRNHTNLTNLFGGDWLFTDRPPLMSGSYLMIADILEFLQINNDGSYLTAQIYNISAIILSTLWLPVFLWIINEFLDGFKSSDKVLILLAVLLVPFSFFNSFYGWPKIFGASFAILAFGLTFIRIGDGVKYNHPLNIITIFLLLALSLLAHMSSFTFCLPLMLFIAIKNLKNYKKALFYGVVFFTIIIFSWQFYKSFYLYNDRLAIFGFTGIENIKDVPFLKALTDFYSKLSFYDWAHKKIVVFNSLFGDTKLFSGSSHGNSYIDKMRSFDIFYLSHGTIIVLILLFNALIINCFYKVRNEAKNFMLLNTYHFLLIPISAIIFSFFVYFCPLNLISIPFPAILSIIFIGTVLTFIYAIRLFYTLIFSQTMYMVSVWFFPSIVNSLHLDFSAVIFMLVLLLLTLLNKLSPHH